MASVPLTNHSSAGQPRPSHRLWGIVHVLTVAIQAFFVLGFSMGSTSPVLADLKEEDGYASLRKPIYQDLFNMSLLVGATVAVLFGGYVTDKIGRKLSSILCSIPYTIGWLLIVVTVKFTDSPAFRPLMFSGRFIVGLSVGWTSLCVNMYVSEMSPDNIRGASLALNQVSLNTGLFLGQLIGVFIPYYWLAIIPLAVTMLGAVLSVATKETPRWLITQGRVIEARRALVWLKGKSSNIDQELKNLSDSVLSQQISVLSQQKIALSEMCLELKNRATYHPIILACIVMLFLQLSGATAIIFNAENIFNKAHVKSPGLVASLATGGVIIIFSIVGMLINDIFGRRKILITAGITACLSHAAMGAYEFVNTTPYCHPPNDPKCKDHLYPLAIASMACFIASYSAGLATVAFSLTAEIIPMHARGIGMGLSLFVNWSCSALIAGLFNSYEAVVRPWGVFWMFSISCLLFAVFVAIFIPETKGKSLEEIERLFSNRKAKQRYLLIQ